MEKIFNKFKKYFETYTSITQFTIIQSLLSSPSALCALLLTTLLSYFYALSHLHTVTLSLSPLIKYLDLKLPLSSQRYVRKKSCQSHINVRYISPWIVYINTIKSCSLLLSTLFLRSLNYQELYTCKRRIESVFQKHILFLLSLHLT